MGATADLPPTSICQVISKVYPKSFSPWHLVMLGLWSHNETKTDHFNTGFTNTDGSLISKYCS